MHKKTDKEIGRFYTPTWIVCKISDSIGYDENSKDAGNVCLAHILDNSCGEGSFLIEVVRRYCENARILGKTSIKKGLETYIHGVDIDEEAVEKCRTKLDLIAEDFGIKNVGWDLSIEDSLHCSRFDHKMDYVVGNPPYVRLQDLKESRNKVQNFNFCKYGTPNLYLAFYELGINQLNKNGTLAYITPNYWMINKSGKAMRDFIVEKNMFCCIFDFEHFRVFNRSTDSSIVILSKNKSTGFIYYYNYDNENDLFQEFSCYDNYRFYDDYGFNVSKEFSEYSEVFSNKGKKEVIVKNGFATLRDRFFIKENFDFNEGVIPVIKASTGEKKKIIFPYDKNGKLLPEKSNSIDNIIKYYSKNKALGMKDFLYGRSQGIKDVYKNKIAVNNLVRSIEDVKLNEAPRGVGVYSGFYILTERSLDEIESILKTRKFISYVKDLRRYKNGGYFTYTAKELEKYLNYKLNIS